MYFTDAEIKDCRSAAKTDAKAYGTFVEVLADWRVLFQQSPIFHHRTTYARSARDDAQLLEAFESSLRRVREVARPA